MANIRIEQMTPTQKVAALLITLGPSAASEIMKNIEDDNNQNINGDEEDIKNPETSVSFNYWIVVLVANVIVIGILTRKAKKLYLCSIS